MSVAALLAGAVLASCAERDGAGTDEVEDTAFPVTVTPSGGEPVTVPQYPERIVSLAAPATETLYELGAGDQVVAVDEQSNYPEEAPTTDLSGLEPSPEEIAEHTPDLVVASEENEDLAEALDSADIPLLTLPAAQSLDDAYDQYELLGEATGNAEEGRELATRVRADLGEIVDDTTQPDEPLTYYHELDESFYSATSATFIGEIYGLFDLENIADGDDPNAMGGYPQLSAERVVDADPDLIFLADTKCCGQDHETVAERPGWGQLSAVENDRVVELDDDIASRWSPRIVDLAGDVSDAVTNAADAAG